MSLKKTIVSSLLCFAILTLAVNAFAADKRNFTIVGRTAIVKTPGKVTPNDWRKDSNLTTISSTLSDFPFGVYFALYNY